MAAQILTPEQKHSPESTYTFLKRSGAPVVGVCTLGLEGFRREAPSSWENERGSK